MFYNVWVTNDSRWCNAHCPWEGARQDEKDPFNLSRSDADTWCYKVNGPYQSESGITPFEVRGIGPNGESIVLFAVKAKNDGKGPVVNDYTCPTCKNTKCSSTETKCWLCGNQL